MTTEAKKRSVWGNAAEAVPVSRRSEGYARYSPGEYEVEIRDTENKLTVERPDRSEQKPYAAVEFLVTKVLDEAKEGQVSYHGQHAGGCLRKGSQPSVIFMDHGTTFHIKDMKELILAALGGELEDDVSPKDADEMTGTRMDFIIDHKLMEGKVIKVTCYWHTYVKTSLKEDLQKAGVTDAEEKAKKSVLKVRYSRLDRG